jgi:hypothetical protein
VRKDRVATFLLKRQPFTTDESARLQRIANQLEFEVLYAPGAVAGPTAADPPEMDRARTRVSDYRELILAPDRELFLARYPIDITPTSDDRPFFFHTTRLGDQMNVAFGRSMLFGNGLSALLTLIGISVLLVALFVGAPLLVGGGRPAAGWSRWLVYFGSLGAGFMLLEVALLQRFVLLLGHPVYSLTVTLFSLLVGTGIGSFISRRVDEKGVKRAAIRALATVVVFTLFSALALPMVIDWAIAWPLPFRVGAAATLLVPAGVLLGVPLPAGMRLVAASRPEIIPWGWGINGALSVLGAAAAVFIAMNWGFFVTLSIAALTYALATTALIGTKSLINN